MRCMRPAWRTSTYSSKLEPVMARNLTRSSSGLEGSSASSSTRRLNCIQDRSRPVKSFCFGKVRVIQSVACGVDASLRRFGRTGNREQGTGIKKRVPDASIKPLRINRSFLRKLGLIGKWERQGIVVSSQFSVLSCQWSVDREQGIGNKD